MAERFKDAKEADNAGGGESFRPHLNFTSR
jgi:hypothetical protein